MPAGKRKSSVIREFSGAEDARQSSTSTLRNGREKNKKFPLSIRKRELFPGEKHDGRLKSFERRNKMPGKALRYWSGSLLVGLFGILAASASASNSIMDIVNVEMVEKLIAERRENASRDDYDRRFVTHNGVDEEDTPDDDGFEGIPDDGAVDERAPHGKQRNRHKFVSKYRPHRHNLTGLPDYGTILADLAGPKLLKSVGESPLITKKEYLKKDWCKTEPMVQKIREDGCLTRSVLNRFCYGQCNSFYVPKTPPRRRRNWKRPTGDDESEESLSFRSCGFCKPKRASWTVVTLRCPHITPRFKKRKIRMIKQCKCIAENVSV